MRAMLRRIGQVAAAGGWLAFPVVPLLAEDLYYSLFNAGLQPEALGGPDPYEWEREQWGLVLGPLFGYGFLAGATWGVADEPGGRWWRRWLAWRSTWVGLGPWFGLWTGWAALTAARLAERVLAAAGMDAPARWLATAAPGPEFGAWIGLATGAWVGLGWLLVARAALRRAARAGRLGAAWARGLGLGVAFVGSLMGGYWAITAAWGGHFFDPTIVP